MVDLSPGVAQPREDRLACCEPEEAPSAAGQAKTRFRC